MCVFKAALIATCKACAGRTYTFADFVKKCFGGWGAEFLTNRAGIGKGFLQGRKCGRNICNTVFDIFDSNGKKILERFLPIVTLISTYVDGEIRNTPRYNKKYHGNLNSYTYSENKKTKQKSYGYKCQVLDNYKIRIIFAKEINDIEKDN